MTESRIYPPPAYPVVTIALVALNLLAWLAQLRAGLPWWLPAPAQLVPWGGDMPLLALRGQGWRLFTAMFLHGGIVHLALNMAALGTVGPRLERQFGSPGALLVYLGGGLVAGAASVGWALVRRHATGDAAALVTVHVGASGAVMAVLGALFAASLMGMPERGEKAWPRMFDRPVFLVVALNLGLGALLPVVDNAGHAGGALAGFVLGLVLSFGTPRRLRPARVAAVVAIVAAVLAALLRVHA